MEQTFTTRAIILDTLPFRERDSRVFLYSEDYGLLSLVVRGARDLKSKLSPALLPLGLVDVMVARGKAFDYLTAVKEVNVFLNIKSDYEKILAAAALRAIKKYAEAGAPDPALFALLREYLNFLDQRNLSDEQLKLFVGFFLLKFMSLSGHQPELFYCVSTAQKISPERHWFDYKNGGLTSVRTRESLTISVNSVKMLRLAVKRSFFDLYNIKLGLADIKEIILLLEKYYAYHYPA